MSRLPAPYDCPAWPVLPKPYDFNKCMMEMAFTISKMSKDTSTKIGSVLVSPDKASISYGYNGFPRKIKDYAAIWNNREKSDDKFTKYELVIHSEENAILNSKRDLTGWSLYVTHTPCIDCAKKVVQVGIESVYYCHGQDKVNMDLCYNKVNDLFNAARINFMQIPIDELEFGI